MTTMMIDTRLADSSPTQLGCPHLRCCASLTLLVKRSFDTPLLGVAVVGAHIRTERGRQRPNVKRIPIVRREPASACHTCEGGRVTCPRTRRTPQKWQPGIPRGERRKRGGPKMAWSINSHASVRDCELSWLPRKDTNEARLRLLFVLKSGRGSQILPVAASWARPTVRTRGVTCSTRRFAGTGT